MSEQVFFELLARNPLSLEALGLTESHLDEFQQADGRQVLLHRQMLADLGDLHNRLALSGFQMHIASGFRNFHRQQHIYTAKWLGQRLIVDHLGQPLSYQNLSEYERLLAILRWSALPGASRHHWGTDFDIYDALAKPDGYDVQLVPDEVSVTGMFAAMHECLDEMMLAEDFPFFRPYVVDRGGIAPERWHISYAPLAVEYQNCVSEELVLAALSVHELVGLEVLEPHIADIYKRFIYVDPQLYPEKWRGALRHA